MVSQFKDITNMKFGRLTVLERAENDKHGNAMWRCACSCGKEKVVLGTSLRKGSTTSCGCKNIEIVKGLKMSAACAHNRSVELVQKTFLPGLTRKPGKNNTSGVKGVRFNKHIGKWQAVINFQGKRIFLGYFNRFDDAVKARKLAEEEYYEPVLNRHGRTIKEGSDANRI